MVPVVVSKPSFLRLPAPALILSLKNSGLGFSLNKLSLDYESIIIINPIINYFLWIRIRMSKNPSKSRMIPRIRTARHEGGKGRPTHRAYIYSYTIPGTHRWRWCASITQSRGDIKTEEFIFPLLQCNLNPRRDGGSIGLPSSLSLTLYGQLFTGSALHSDGV